MTNLEIRFKHIEDLNPDHPYIDNIDMRKIENIESYFRECLPDSSPQAQYKSVNTRQREYQEYLDNHQKELNNSNLMCFLLLYICFCSVPKPQNE